MDQLCFYDIMYFASMRGHRIDESLTFTFSDKSPCKRGNLANTAMLMGS